MKCPACGYHNPPGISGCARCGPAGPARPACAVPEASETFYPPRARDVPAGQRLYERLASRRAADVEAPEWSVRVHEFLCSVALVLVAMVPGLGQALQGRWTRAAQLAAACAVLGGLFAALFHRPASDRVLELLLVLCMLSVGDVTAQRYPPLRPAEGAGWRAMLLGWGRIALFSAGVVFAALAVGFWALSAAYTPWNVTEDWLGTTFREGDVLVVQRPPRSAGGLRRGEVVTFEDRRGPGLERVLALPGDRISLDASGVRVNGAPVPSMPRTVSGGSPFNSRVPGDTVALSAEGQEVNPVRFVPFPAVRGRVIAILEPAGRRSWVR